MSKLSGLLSTALFVCLFVVASAAAAPQPEKIPPLNGVSIGIGAEYESGDYGTDSRVETWRIPLLIDWSPTAWLGLSFEIPYLMQTGSSETLVLGGGGMSPRGGRMGSGTTAQSQTLTSSRTESGPGDITLDADLQLLRETDARPRLSARLYFKLPTADADKGLGTGEFDWGAGLATRKILGDWSLQAKALYIQPGTSPLYDPSAYWDWSAGLDYLGGLRLRPGLTLSGGTAAFSTEDDPLEAGARLGIMGQGPVSFSLYLSHGLSDASPEWGSGIICYFDF